MGAVRGVVVVVVVVVVTTCTIGLHRRVREDC